MRTLCSVSPASGSEKAPLKSEIANVSVPSSSSVLGKPVTVGALFCTSKAPMSKRPRTHARETGAALDRTGPCHRKFESPALIAGLPANKREGSGRPAVVFERAEFRVNVSEVMRGRAGKDRALRVADEIVIARIDGAGQIGIGVRRVARHNSVAEIERAPTDEDAAAVVRAVARQRARIQRENVVADDTTAAAVAAVVGSGYRTACRSSASACHCCRYRHRCWQCYRTACRSSASACHCCRYRRQGRQCCRTACKSSASGWRC